MIDLGRGAKKIKCEANKSEDEAFSKLTTMSAELRTDEEEATKSRNTRENEYEVMLVKGEREVHKLCESLRTDIYKRRSEIIKSIPHFWLIAFLSHYALHLMLCEEDQKIFRFLNSTISYTIMSTDPLKEYSDGEMNIRTSSILWKDDLLALITGTSFFTWFSGLGCLAMETYDEVADLIKQDLWPDANDGIKVDLAAINKAAGFTSSQRAFFI
ncbi:hypothetical protein MKX03_011918 [Papaver bracteatum]|nr:hypothetical protein MKX03_011918 [Papaver bracteatum]